MWLDRIATPAVANSAPMRMEAAFAAAAAIEAIPPEVEHRVRWLSQDPVAKVRVYVLDLLAARGASDFTSWIARPLLTDADPHVRGRAAEVLGDAEKLLELVRDDRVAVELRTRAATVLDTMGAPEERLAAAEALAAGHGPLQDTSIDLCQSIGESSETVIMSLARSRDGMVARKAVALLGRIGTARSLAILQEVVDDPAHVLVQHEANAALESLRTRSAASRRMHRSTPPAEPRTATPRSRGRSNAPSRPGQSQRRAPSAER
jgi:hypothetical protein